MRYTIYYMLYAMSYILRNLYNTVVSALPQGARVLKPCSREAVIHEGLVFLQGHLWVHTLIYSCECTHALTY